MQRILKKSKLLSVSLFMVTVLSILILSKINVYAAVLANNGSDGTVSFDGVVNNSTLVSTTSSNDIVTATDVMASGLDFVGYNGTGTSASVRTNVELTGITGHSGSFTKFIGNTNGTIQYLEVRANSGIFDLNSIMLATNDTVAMAVNDSTYFDVQALDVNFHPIGPPVRHILNVGAWSTLTVTGNSDFVGIGGIRITPEKGVQVLVDEISLENPRMPSDSSITPTTASFDKYMASASYNDISVNMIRNGYDLSNITNGANTLSLGTDYTVVGNLVTIKKGYLETLSIGTATLNFNFCGGTIATQSLSIGISDATPQNIILSTLSGNNDYVDINLSKGGYGAADGITPLTADKLALTFNQNTGGTATNAVISSIKQNDGTTESAASALTGGESVIRVFLTVTGIPSGVETIEIKPVNSTAIYNKAGNAMEAAQTTGIKTLNSTVVTPTASPVGGVVASGTTVTLSSSTAGATIYYTIDGSTPTMSSTSYTGPITVSSAVTIKAIAVASGMTNSTVMSESYTITSTLTHTLTYDGNGALGSPPVDSNSYYVNTSVTAAGAGGLSRTHYNFTGWNTAADGTGTGVAAGGSFNITGNTTLYAQWSEDPKYTVTYNGNGNTGGTPPVDSSSYYVNTIVTSAELGSLSKIHYTFTGWNTSADGTGASIAAGASFVITGNTSWYAQWTLNSPEPPTGLTATAGDGHVELSWDAVNGAVSYKIYQGTTSGIYYATSVVTSTSTAITGLTNGATYYFVIKTSNAGGDSVNSSEVSGTPQAAPAQVAMPTASPAGGAVANGTTITLSSSTTGELIYYTTDGSIPTETSTEYTTPIVATSAMTIKAIAVKSGMTDSNVMSESYTISNTSTYKVIYDGNGNTGGSVPIDSALYTSGQTVTAVNNTGNLQKTGYAFAGWNTSSDGAGTNYGPSTSDNEFTIVNSDVTLYARWTSSSKTVISVDSISDISVENGTSKINLGLPTTVGVTLNDSAKTSMAVTWDNGNPQYQGNTAGTYTFTGELVLPSGVTNPSDLKASLNVIVGTVNNPIPTNTLTKTTPASVTIKGTERVGKTLEAELLTDTRARFTTSAGVTFEWYRLSNKDSDSGKLVGDDETYDLVSSDRRKYIKVVAAYNGKSFEDITGKIESRLSDSDDDDDDDDDSSANRSNLSESAGNNTSTSNNPSTSIINGWEDASNNTRRYIENEYPVIGWKKIDGLWYLFDSAGIMQTGWRQDNDKWYYLESHGIMVVGWELINGNWYLLNNDGSMSTGWAQVDGKWYYLNADGTMVTGWIEVDGKWYYLYGDGSLATNTVINGYRVDEQGLWIQ